MLTNELLQQADKNYRTFPTFQESSKAFVDVSKWDKYSALLKEVITKSPTILKEAQEHIKRAAAIQTGMIEGLYEVDRGFTITATAEVAIWQAALTQRETTTRSLIEAQMKAYDYVLDFATQSIPIGEAYIRELHRVICAGQTTYKVYTPVGVQEHELPCGEYKRQPNHVLQANGNIHSYSPVEMTSSEMHRLCEELNSQAFINSHPILQASYIHYCLTVIHPFADGNGRVARALASIYTYRSNSIPLLIADDTKKTYFDSLEAADDGKFQNFVDFIFERGIDSIRLVIESLRAASHRPIEESTQSIRKLFLSKGGYHQVRVDEAGYRFFDLFKEEINRQLKELNLASAGEIETQFNPLSGDVSKSPKRTTNRFPLQKGQRGLEIGLRTKKPAEAAIVRTFVIEVPKDSGLEDDLLISCHQSKDEIEARMTEVIPLPSISVEMRLSIAVKSIVAGMAEELLVNAKNALQSSGYH